MDTKQCTKCNKDKQFTDFHKGRSVCKLCRAEYDKQYRAEHKEQLQQKSKVYNETHKEKIKEYREKHKEQISEKLKEKVICICGCEVRKDGLKRHEGSEIHKDLLDPKLKSCFQNYRRTI